MSSDVIEFDFKEADTIYKLLQCMNYATGFFANKPILDYATGFQMMIFENIFCWFYKDLDELGFRKKLIEEVYLEIGRKAGKSFLCAVIEILIMLRSDKFAQTACAGKTRDISSLVRNSISEIIQASPLIKKHFKITRDKITCKLNDCTMKHLSGEANNINGLLLSSYIVDEVCNQEDSSIIDALKLSMMNTKTRLAIYISTQYANPKNAFNDLIDYHKSILDNSQSEIINTFGLLFELDNGDNYEDEINWYKCNPLQMSMENGRQFLRSEFNKGKSIPSAMTEFRIKILNERIADSTNTKYMDMNKFNKCIVKQSPIDITNRDCFVGLDFSSKIDLSGATIQIPFIRESDNKLCHIIFNYSFVPNDECLVMHQKVDKMPFLAWKDKYVFTTNTPIIDQDFIIDFIKDIIKKYNLNVLGWCVDPHNASLTTTRLLAEGEQVFEIFTSHKHLNETTEGFRAEVISENIYVMDNPCFNWQMNNAFVETDKNGYIKIDKKKQRYRIDNVDSTLNSNKLAMYWKPTVDLESEIMSGRFSF